MKQKVIFLHDNKEGNTTFCLLYYKDEIFVGLARCHPEDEDMKSRLMGEIIAEMRAEIKKLNYIRNKEIKPEIKALQRLYDNMKFSKRFNPKSYESISLFRRIHHLEKQLDRIEIEILLVEQDLKDYLAMKEKSHKLIREYRNKTTKLVEDN